MGENIFNINSENQQGGITAGIINIFRKYSIVLSEDSKKHIVDALGKKDTTIHVSLQSGGSSELTQLAQDIKSFLLEQGYTNVLGVHTIMGFEPFKGINIEKKSETESVIFIGALL